jgi:hypothetical protein
VARQGSAGHWRTRAFTPVVRRSHLGSESNRPGNSRVAGNRRVREFWTKSLGVREEPSRFRSDPKNSLSNQRVQRQRWGCRKPLGKRRKRQDAESSNSRRLLLTGVPHWFAARGKDPRPRDATSKSLVEVGAYRIKRLRPGTRIELHPWQTADSLSEPPPPPPRVKRDPLELARFYQSLLDRGVVENRAGLASYLGVSRARVTQVFSRLERAKEGGGHA